LDESVSQYARTLLNENRNQFLKLLSKKSGREVEHFFNRTTFKHLEDSFGDIDLNQNVSLIGLWNQEGSELKTIDVTLTGGLTRAHLTSKNSLVCEVELGEEFSFGLLVAKHMKNGQHDRGNWQQSIVDKILNVHHIDQPVSINFMGWPRLMVFYAKEQKLVAGTNEQDQVISADEVEKILLKTLFKKYGNDDVAISNLLISCWKSHTDRDIKTLQAIAKESVRSLEKQNEHERARNVSKQLQAEISKLSQAPTQPPKEKTSTLPSKPAAPGVTILKRGEPLPIASSNAAPVPDENQKKKGFIEKSFEKKKSSPGANLREFREKQESKLTKIKKNLQIVTQRLSKVFSEKK
jgi:hypothetical protein